MGASGNGQGGWWRTIAVALGSVVFAMLGAWVSGAREWMTREQVEHYVHEECVMRREFRPDELAKAIEGVNGSIMELRKGQAEMLVEIYAFKTMLPPWAGQGGAGGGTKAGPGSAQKRGHP